MRQIVLGLLVLAGVGRAGTARAAGIINCSIKPGWVMGGLGGALPKGAEILCDPALMRLNAKYPQGKDFMFEKYLVRGDSDMLSQVADKMADHGFVMDLKHSNDQEIVMFNAAKQKAFTMDILADYGGVAILRLFMGTSKGPQH